MPEAEAHFLHRLEQPVGRLREVRADLLVKLYLCRAIGAACTARLLEAQIEASRAYLDRLFRLAADAAPGSFERLVSDPKIGAARATVA